MDVRVPLPGRRLARQRDLYLIGHHELRAWKSGASNTSWNGKRGIEHREYGWFMYRWKLIAENKPHAEAVEQYVQAVLRERGM